MRERAFNARSLTGYGEMYHQMRARGFQVDKKESEGKKVIYWEKEESGCYKINGGIDSWYKQSFQAGRRLYKFGNKNENPNEIRLRAWWLDYDTIKAIVDLAYFSDTMFGVDYFANRYFAIPQCWNDCGTLIRCVFLEPFEALIGRGRPARDPTTGQIYYGDHVGTGGAAFQIYIPDIPAHPDCNRLEAVFDSTGKIRPYLITER